MSEARATHREDGFLNNRLRLRSAPGGHRAGTDAVLLAASTPPQETGPILDAGAGEGAVGLMAGLFAPKAALGLIEIDTAACALARRNIAENGVADRARVFEADLLDPAARRAAGLCDEQAALVLTNPPFHVAGRTRVSPDPDKARAHVASAPLAEWVRACLALLAPVGEFVMIHRADALAACLASVEGRLGGVAIVPVSPRAGAAAVRILLRGRKGSRAPLSLLAPLVLHEADGSFTPLAQALHRGEAHWAEDGFRPDAS